MDMESLSCQPCGGWLNLPFQHCRLFRRSVNHPAQSASHLACPAVAPLWRLLQSPVQDPIHFPGQFPVEAAGRQVSLMYYLIESGVRIVPGEGQSSG